MEINWKPIIDHKFITTTGMFLRRDKSIYLVGNASHYDPVENNELVVSYLEDLGDAIFIDNVTHYINPEDLTDDQILYLYKKASKGV